VSCFKKYKNFNVQRVDFSKQIFAFIALTLSGIHLDPLIDNQESRTEKNHTTIYIPDFLKSLHTINDIVATSIHENEEEKCI